MAQLEWHSETTAFFTLRVAIQGKYFVTVRLMVYFRGKPFIKDLADNPEFLMLVDR